MTPRLALSSYAVKSRKGYIPPSLGASRADKKKYNQDAYIICKNFGNIGKQWFYAVCDGHGINGHYVSDFVKKQLPINITQSLFQLKKEGVSPNNEIFEVEEEYLRRKQTLKEGFKKTHTEVCQ